MGGAQSNSFSSDLGSYKVVDKSVENNITYLLHSETQKEYLLRQLTFNDESIYKKNLTELEKRKSIENEHLTQLKRVQGKTIDHLCSNVYKIYAMWEYPQRYLSTEINERALQKRKFQEKQLWSILASLILGMSTLQKNKIKHESLNTKNILLDNEGLVKVADPLATGTTSNLDLIYSNRHAKKQCESLDCRSIYSNPYKNDVWSMGMILLQCGLLQRQDPCYKDEYQRIDHEQLQNNIRRFGLEYSEELRIITEVMLKRDNKDRPDWLDLEQYTKKSSDKSEIVESAEKTEKPVNASFSPIYNYENSKPKYVSYEQQQKKQQPKVNLAPYQAHEYSYPQTVRSDYFYQPVKAPPPPQLNQPNRNTTQPPFQSAQQSFVPFPPTVYNPNMQTNSPPKKFVSQISPQKFPTNPNQGYQQNGPHFQNPYLSMPQQNFMKPENPYQPQIFPQFKPEVSPHRTSLEAPFQNNLVNLQSEPKKQINQEQFKTFGKRQMYEPVQNKPSIEGAYRPPVLNSSVTPEITPEKKPTLSKNPQSNDLEYVIQTFKQGSRYEGYKLDDMRHGEGKFYYQDGGMYDGSWNRNKMDGYGSLYYQSGKLAYQGMWKSDQFQGKGKLFNEAPQKLDLPFDYRNFDQIDEYWEYYEGDFIEDLKKGRGKLMLSNGQYFEGTFQNDMVEGPGKFYCGNGKVVEGVWQSNQYISS